MADWGDGFDCYAAFADAHAGYWDSGAGTPTFVAGRFSGSQALHVTATSTVLTKSNGANDAVHHLVVAFRQTAAISGTTLGLYLQLLDGTTGQCCVVFRSDGAILLTSGTPAGTVLDTYTGAFPVTNTWYAFEFEVAISNTTGSWAVRKNGNTVNDRATGSLDTQVSANAYANKLTVGMQAAVNSHEIDDLYWRSSAATGSFLSDIRCYTRMPASDAAVQFSRTPGTTAVMYNTSVANNGGPIANTIWFIPIAATFSGSAAAGLASFFASVTGSVNMAMYDNSGITGSGIFASGSPGVLLAQGVPLTDPGIGLQTFTYVTPVSVTKGTQYWIAMFSDVTLNLKISGSSSLNKAALNAAYSGGNFPASAAGAGITGLSNGFTYVGFLMAPTNASVVAEAQQDAATSYVYSSTPGHADLYGIAPIASTPLTTFAVTTRAYAIKSDAGTRTMAVQLKSGGTTVGSPTLVLTTSNWQWAWRHDTTDPATGAAWTAAAVNVAQVGPVVIA